MSKKIGRNVLYPCGGGKKFKKCCIDRIDTEDRKEFSNPENVPETYRKLERVENKAMFTPG